MQNPRPPKPHLPLLVYGGCHLVPSDIEFFLYLKLHMVLWLLLFRTDKLVKIKQIFSPLAFTPSLSTYFLLGLFFSTQKFPFTNGGVLVICQFGFYCMKGLCFTFTLHFACMYASVQCMWVHVWVCPHEDGRVEVRDHCQVMTSVIVLRPVIWDRVSQQASTHRLARRIGLRALGSTCRCCPTQCSGCRHSWPHMTFTHTCWRSRLRHLSVWGRRFTTESPSSTALTFKRHFPCYLCYSKVLRPEKEIDRD